MLIGQGVDSGLPYVDQRLPDGRVERRFLTALPTPKDHPMRALPGFEQATGITPIPRSQWPSLQFERRHTAVPIIDQDGKGKCVASASCSSVMIIRDRAGMTFVFLSDSQLYTQINGGRDAGSYAGAAIQALMAHGIAPASAVPGDPIRPAGVSASAMAAAAAYKLRPDGAVQINTFDEAVTAVAYGWQLLFDVEAGSAYTTGPSGVVTFLGRGTNHEQSAGEGLKILSDGTMGILGRNSWGASWGTLGGWGWYTERHFLASDSIWAVKYMLEDPSDPNNPPALP